MVECKMAVGPNGGQMVEVGDSAWSYHTMEEVWWPQDSQAGRCPYVGVSYGSGGLVAEPG